MRIALLQLNTTIGDIKENALKIIKQIKKYDHQKVDLFVTSELALTGYPPKDLLLNELFLKKAQYYTDYLAKSLKSYSCLLGTVIKNPEKVGKPVFNAAVFINRGKILGHFYKNLLPNYDVFEEDRYFEPGLSINL